MYGYLEETLSIDTFFNTVVELNKSKGTSGKAFLAKEYKCYLLQFQDATIVFKNTLLNGTAAMVRLQ